MSAVEKSADAYRTISEVAEELKLPQHVLRFWETRFPQVKPLKRGGNRRFYRPGDVELLRAIKILLYGDGFTIKGVQRIFKEQGPRAVANLAQSGQVRSFVNSRADQDGQSHQVNPASAEPPALHAEAGTAVRSEPRAASSTLELERSGPGGRVQTLAAAQAGRVETTPVVLLDGLQTVLYELSECLRILAVARS